MAEHSFSLAGRTLVDPTSRSSEPFRELRVALQLRSTTGHRCTVVTSPEPATGKSTIVANYALIASLGHQSVLMIDGDMRRPTLHTIFGVPRLPGLADVLLDSEATLESVAIDLSPPGGRLALLTAGRVVARPGDLVSSPRMSDLIARAMNGFDIVVIDSPPILSAPDAEDMAAQVGVDVLLVVRKNTKRNTLRKTVRRLQLIDSNLAGVVLNRLGRPSASYAYGADPGSSANGDVAAARGHDDERRRRRFAGRFRASTETYTS